MWERPLSMASHADLIHEILAAEIRGITGSSCVAESHSQSGIGGSGTQMIRR